MKFLNLITIVSLFIAVACSTTGHFKIPAGSKLYVEGKPLTEAEVANYTRNPFFWDVSKGIPYMLEQDGKVVDKGFLKSQFRVASIFWTPGAVIYWPLGFNKAEYDLTSKADIKVRPEATYVDAKHRK